MVETVICGIYGESPHDVLVTTVDGQCTHEKVVYSFTPCFVLIWLSTSFQI